MGVSSSKVERDIFLDACANGDCNKVSEFILENFNVNAKTSEGWTGLHLASHKGHVDIVTILLNYKASINMQDKKGFTALMYACQEGHENIVKVLLKHKARDDIIAQDLFDSTAYTCAASNYHWGVCKLLESPYHNPNQAEKSISAGAMIQVRVFQGVQFIGHCCFHVIKMTVLLIFGSARKVKRSVDDFLKSK
ncbi:ankyrin repeat-containing protein [Plakobranchus ocellatus]|uniref:Ankyrin repeat-containing protein n=1 Tax=Plakobranchus ocellatus TaxID=259542 RepID=A0AAV4BG15_9GAST|nr:ankyrin repeat-containing protein [Plakobranchus ocellatus]